MASVRKANHKWSKIKSIFGALSKTEVKPKKKRKKAVLYKQENSLFVPKRSKDNYKVKRELAEGFKSRKFPIMNYTGMKSMPIDAPPGFREALDNYKTSGGTAPSGAGGVGSDFPQGDIGQPFWFSNIGGNHFPREGFTYQPYDLPIVPLTEQLKGYIDDEDAQMGINFLAAKTTGGQHYFKAKTKGLSKYVEQWTNQINLNWLNWQIGKELLAYGNCFVRLRKPIWNCNRPEDFHILPIEAAVRIWWTPDRRPLWYEFRGAQYNGYFRPGEILHFVWNPINGQIYGFGIMAQLVNRVSYLEDTPDGSILKERESYMDIKHGLQNVSYKVMKRYLPRLIIDAHKASEETRDAIREEMRILHDSEDIVHGIPGMKLDEVNTQTRPIDPAVFLDMFQASIFKATQTSKGRIAGASQGPTYANGEESAILDEVGLAQFPIQLKYQIQEYIVKPWYEFNRHIDPLMYDGIIAVPWKSAEYEMMFGKQSKKDLEPEQVAQWVQILQNAGQISSNEIRKIAEYVGVPELLSDLEGGMAPDQPGVGPSGNTPMQNPTSQMKKNPTGEEGQDNQQVSADTGQGMGTDGQAMKVSGSPNKSKFSRV